MSAPVPSRHPWPAPHLGVSAIVGVGVLAVMWARAFGGGPLGVRTAALLAVCVYLSIAAHELGHAAVARLTGARVHRISVNAMGGLTEYDREGGTAGREALIAAAGPFVNLVVAGVSLAMAAQGDSFGRFAAALCGANLLLALFNLIPAAPLDGGTLVSSAVWRATGSRYRGAAAASWCGRVLAAAVGLAPFVLLGAGMPVSVGAAVSALMFAAFLFATASAHLFAARIEARTGGLTAADVCRPALTCRVGADGGADSWEGPLVEVGGDGVPVAVTVAGQSSAAVAVPAGTGFADVLDAASASDSPLVVVGLGGGVAGVVTLDELQHRVRAAARNEDWHG